MNPKTRYSFIGNALRGDGPFRPTVSYDQYGKPSNSGASYIIKYGRENDAKYASRNEIAFFESPLYRVTDRFVSHISAKPVQRDINQQLLKNIYDDTDGKGNDIDVFFGLFMVEAKARGAMLLLVDMPAQLPGNMGSQITERASPYWTPLLPEQLTDYQVGNDGKFDFAEFSGTYVNGEGDTVECLWYFDREKWECRDTGGVALDGNDHPLGECPILIFTENGDFPSFGPFAPIADLSKRLFNLDSEMDEILRSQTFSLLTLEVPEDSSAAERLEAAQTSGETIGTQNMMVHTGKTPAFIAPSEGPAAVYERRIQEIRSRINDIGLEIAAPEQRESGIAMQMRFQAINAALAAFSVIMEGLERRAWELSARWLGMDETPEIMWPTDFNIADPAAELEILRNMEETNMSPEVIAEQQKKVISVQFANMEMDTLETLAGTIDNVLSAT